MRRCLYKHPLAALGSRLPGTVAGVVFNYGACPVGFYPALLPAVAVIYVHYKAGSTVSAGYVLVVIGIEVTGGAACLIIMYPYKVVQLVFIQPLLIVAVKKARITLMGKNVGIRQKLVVVNLVSIMVAYKGNGLHRAALKEHVAV